VYPLASYKTVVTHAVVICVKLTENLPLAKRRAICFQLAKEVGFQSAGKPQESRLRSGK